MPIYEYVCADCGKRFEHLARTFSDRPKACPDCGAERLSKALSTFCPDVRGGSAASGCAQAAACPHAHGPGCGCCH